MTTIKQHLDSIYSLTFTAASQLEVPTKIRKIVVSQCGYIRGEQMSIGKTSTGAYRLFVRVGGKWMDGSLSNIA